MEVRLRVRRGSPTALTHALEIAQAKLTLTLRERAAAGEFVLLAFDPEARHAWRVRPDASLRFRHQGVEYQAFLEIDLGHTSGAEWQKKRDIAGRFLTSGLYARRYGDFPFMIWTLTPTARRAANLRRLAEQDGMPHYRFGTLTEFAALADPDTPLSLISPDRA